MAKEKKKEIVFENNLYREKKELFNEIETIYKVRETVGVPILYVLPQDTQ